MRFINTSFVMLGLSAVMAAAINGVFGVPSSLEARQICTKLLCNTNTGCDQDGCMCVPTGVGADGVSACRSLRVRGKT